MKWFALLGILVFLAGCASGGREGVPVTIPDLGSDTFYDSPYQEGWRLLREGKSRAAMDRFEQSRVEDDKLFMAFGYTFLVQNKLGLAQKNFERALEINPNNISAELGLAAMYERRHEIDMAFRVYAHLRAKYPENAWVKVRYDYIRSTQTEHYLRQAEANKQANDDEGVIAALERAESYSDDIIEIKIRIADFHLDRGELEEAARYYEKVVEKLPNREDILLRLADCYEKLEQYDSALAVYRRISELRPGDLQVSKKINDLKVKFYDLELPTKFKNIFFKYYINREDLAALVGHYFQKFLRPPDRPLIITDIGESFAREQIITLCTLGILEVRPDHRFERYTEVNRATFAVVLDALIHYLRREGYDLKVVPREDIVEPTDVSPLHKNYGIIKFMVNAQILSLDDADRFNPTAQVSPAEALDAIRRLINNLNR